LYFSVESLGYGIMKEYLDEPEKTRETIDENKWLKTGFQSLLF
jgi:hypothetical protein